MIAKGGQGMLTYNERRTRLKRGDTIAWQKNTQRVMVFRNAQETIDHRLCWGNGDNKSHLVVSEAAFDDLVNLIADILLLKAEKIPPDNEEEYVTYRLG